MTNKLKADCFEVWFTLVVDHPELRGPSYQPVPAGHRVHTVMTCKTHKEAALLADGMIAGEWDFGSEYMTSVQAVARKAGHGVLRNVRKLRCRDGRNCGWYAESDRHNYEPNHEGKRLAS
jgi:hypothetical protein